MTRVLPSIATLIARVLGTYWTNYLLIKLAYPVYSKIKHGRTDYIRRINLQTVTLCSRACTYCAYGHIKSLNFRGQMSEETFDAVIDRLKEMQWKEVVGFGVHGEPLLDKRLPGFVKRLSDIGCLTHIYSNGDCLDLDLMEKLVKAGIWRIGVTRHPPVPDWWDAQIEQVVKKYPSKVGVQVLGENPTGLHNHAGTIPGHDGTTGPCDRPGEAFSIRFDGKYALCCNDPYGVPMGDVKSMGIMESWDSPKFSGARRELLKGNRVYAVCKKCDPSKI